TEPHDAGAFGPLPPEIEPRADPLAVAVGNASLLGVGYALLGRGGAAVGSALLTVVLVATHVMVPSGWIEGALVLWWVALVVHGWYAAGGRIRSTSTELAPTGSAHSWRQRFIASAIALPVLLGVGYLRLDAREIEQTANAAHRTGDCQDAVTTLQQL